ncbi:hypothetical protein EV217_5051 [Phyllobacterium myrsinacearum]|uniref:hypothetical protein n=1 Tax=Phyllobacterium myrsinacearum TaxID=28101 RepID=UPI00102A6542|nr:hypothetical protein [Phyllobacterium myrsinacearum]RZS76821.1 hypothetical protein EV217_5051 [Phyllobacterium myrsinacearum]
MTGVPPTIYVVISDYGAEQDDQKAWSQFAAHLNPHDVVFAMAGGPQPPWAARAIAQKVQHETGTYPITAEATPFESEKTPKEKIFSLVNGRPIYGQELPGFSSVSREKWQKEIDKAVKRDIFSNLQIVVLSPLFKNNEIYDIARAKSDKTLAASLKKLRKTATLQIIRNDGEFDAYNYNKSTPGLVEAFHQAAVQNGFTITYVNGNVAKLQPFKILARQPELPGVENTIDFYMRNLQVPWANMPGPTATVPTAEQMHVTMFTPKGEYPCLFHMSGAYAYGFGRERLARDICAIHDPLKYEVFSNEIDEELNRFDTEVLTRLFGKECDVAAKRKEMHDAMLHALNIYADQKGVKGSFETFQDFFAAVNEMARQTESKAVASPFTYIKGYTHVLFETYPWYKQITDLAQEYADRPGPDGKSHLDKMITIIKKRNPHAVAFDAVALASAHVIDSDPRLAEYFTEEDGIRVIDPGKVDGLEEFAPKLYEEFAAGVRAHMTLDGTAMAYAGTDL